MAKRLLDHLGLDWQGPALARNRSPGDQPVPDAGGPDDQAADPTCPERPRP